MSKRPVPFETTIHVRDHCLCLHVQRAARMLARHFDQALKPLGLTNQQFSLLMALNRPGSTPMGPLAHLLGMDRTSLTAALKPLERRGLLAIAVSQSDKRARQLTLTPDGEALLARAVPIWVEHHGAIEAAMGDGTADALRANLATIAA
ncbi:MarR family winged helix-turn-helix transcriptional regulator [Sphingomonas montanisoli]|uniref:MarR family transcriptional regulator n=1 Tax=Sphingomonas montanisoli TaxID=2606412 RepID=A0A5D9C4T9_9SPHN|nr:MarR family transcriptional regulator [Sphingomonas montanisoli]TZG26227.1 MarR family transcriptional regulator [Sphingomonas montanisoli]